MKRFKVYLMMICGLLSTASLAADQGQTSEPASQTAPAGSAQSPVAMLQNTSDQMIAQLKQNKAQIKSNPNFVFDLARKIMLPHVDIAAMSRLALGREHWTNATPAQQQQFMDEFTNLMLSTYGTALASYNNETVKFKPLRSDPSTLARIQVDSVIAQNGGPDIPVSYRLFFSNNQWMVYDITVDGVSMIQSFRSQFASEISRQGMDGLLTAMKQKRGTNS